MAKKMAKKSAKKRAGKKTARKPAKKKTKARPASASGAGRVTWFDAEKHKPLISEYAQRLQPFMQAIDDGRIDQVEVNAQEKRLMASMKEVEPLLNNAIHGKVTRLLCEMAAYDLMQALHAIQSSRPQSVFRG